MEGFGRVVGVEGNFLCGYQVEYMNDNILCFNIKLV